LIHLRKMLRMRRRITGLDDVLAGVDVRHIWRRSRVLVAWSQRSLTSAWLRSWRLRLALRRVLRSSRLRRLASNLRATDRNVGRLSGHSGLENGRAGRLHHNVRHDSVAGRHLHDRLVVLKRVNLLHLIHLMHLRLQMRRHRTAALHRTRAPPPAGAGAGARFYGFLRC
jgi:hypothetical protein